LRLRGELPPKSLAKRARISMLRADNRAAGMRQPSGQDIKEQAT